MLRRPTHLRPVLFASLALGLIVSSACGCKSWDRWGNWKDDGFSEDDQKLTKDVRPREPNATFWSTSTKGQQIERNLGVGRD